jgi:Ca2+-binding RTX toxin-like protein
MDSNTAVKAALALSIALLPMVSLVAESDSLAATVVITGTPGPDNLLGTPGSDTIQGLGGADVMTGLTGNDTYIVDNVDDEVVEEPDQGTDTVRAPPNYFLPPNVENLVLTGGRSGQAGGNVLNNRIIGNSAGNFISGGLGNDVLRGGAGNDWFVFSSHLTGRANVDRLPDFSVGEDRMFLHVGAFPALLGLGSLAPLPSYMFHLGASATSASHHILYDAITGIVRYDGDGTGPETPVSFAVLPTGLALTSHHFLIRSTLAP